MTAQTKSPESTEWIFYDGECGVCHWAVAFVARRDASGRAFRFAPLYGETFMAAVGEGARASLPDTMVVLTAEGSLLLRSAGLIHILGRLGAGWRLSAGLLWLVPRALRDTMYDGLAAARYRLAGRPRGTCPRVAAEIRQQFDP